jgi:hypothetical protein
MTSHYDDTITQPLTSDALIEERIGGLIGRANRRQLWFLFLDENGFQLPLIMPFGDPPLRPDRTVSSLARIIGNAVDDECAHSVIVVLERYADEVITDADRSWARCITDELQAIEVPVRAILVSHRKGVRWLAQDDYRFGATVP